MACVARHTTLILVLSHVLGGSSSLAANGTRAGRSGSSDFGSESSDSGASRGGGGAAFAVCFSGHLRSFGVLPGLREAAKRNLVEALRGDDRANTADVREPTNSLVHDALIFGIL